MFTLLHHHRVLNKKRSILSKQQWKTSKENLKLPIPFKSLYH